MSLKHICMNNRVDIWTCTFQPCTSMNHSLRYAPSMSNCTISVSITTHVIWYWHTGHAIMFSRHSVPEPLYMQCIWLGTSGNMSVLTSSVAPLLTACGCAWHTHMRDIVLHIWDSTFSVSICRTVWCQACFVLCSRTASPHIISTVLARWNKGGIPQRYKAGSWGGMQGHTRTCVCAHTRTHTCTQAHTCTHTCGHTSTACVCICSSRFLEPLSPPSLCDLSDL